MNGPLNNPQERECHLEESGANLLFLQALLSHSLINQKSKILEIGCGTGILANYLLHITGAKVVGTEMSKPTHSISSKRIKCYYQPLGGLPKNIGKFDLIYCKDVLPSNFDKSNFYEMIYSHLRKGGIFCTYLPTLSDIRSKPILWFIPQSIVESEKCYGTIEGNICLLKRSGYKVVESSRIFLGTVRMDENYLLKHLDGYFSNTNKSKLSTKRLKGLNNLRQLLTTNFEYGLSTYYKWERTMIIAKK